MRTMIIFIFRSGNNKYNNVIVYYITVPTQYRLRLYYWSVDRSVKFVKYVMVVGSNQIAGICCKVYRKKKRKVVYNNKIEGGIQ